MVPDLRNFITAPAKEGATTIDSSCRPHTNESGAFDPTPLTRKLGTIWTHPVDILCKFII
jgi:hypothetical protein